jgi:hypothetical protein
MPPKTQPMAWFVAAFLVPAALAAHAAPATEEDFEEFRQALFAASIHSNPDLVRENCRKAENIAARFDPNPAWQGLAMECFGTIEYALRNKEVACRYYARALVAFERAQPAAYEAESVERARKQVSKGRVELGC